MTEYIKFSSIKILGIAKFISHHPVFIAIEIIIAIIVSHEHD